MGEEGTMGERGWREGKLWGKRKHKKGGGDGKVGEGGGIDRGIIKGKKE